MSAIVPTAAVELSLKGLANQRRSRRSVDKHCEYHVDNPPGGERSPGVKPRRSPFCLNSWREIAPYIGDLRRGQKFVQARAMALNAVGKVSGGAGTRIGDRRTPTAIVALTLALADVTKAYVNFTGGIPWQIIHQLKSAIARA